MRIAWRRKWPASVQSRCLPRLPARPCPLHDIGRIVLVVLMIVLGPQSTWSQSRTVKLVVPFPGGGLNETMFRVIADQVGRQGGPTFIIEPRPGAGTMIGTEVAARAAPDGNTVLLVSNAFLINAHLKKLTYDPLTSFEPICYLWQSPNVFAVNAVSPYKSLVDLIEGARAKPGDLTMAASGPATGVHVASEQLKRAVNVQMTFVPFAGGGPVVNALLGNHVISGLADYGLLAEHINSGKLRALAVAPRTRIDALPNVPTVEETGLAGYEADIWYGLVAPARTPKEKISQFVEWMTVALRVPEVRAKLIGVGLYPVSVCGTDFSTHLRSQYEKYGRIIREANIKSE
jgi:tripartite-type tricarboxylate transporter receptor subunit TctC